MDRLLSTAIGVLLGLSAFVGLLLTTLFVGYLQTVGLEEAIFLILGAAFVITGGLCGFAHKL